MALHNLVLNQIVAKMPADQNLHFLKKIHMNSKGHLRLNALSFLLYLCLTSYH